MGTPLEVGTQWAVSVIVVGKAGDLWTQRLRMSRPSGGQSATGATKKRQQFLRSLCGGTARRRFEPPKLLDSASVLGKGNKGSRFRKTGR